MQAGLNFVVYSFLSQAVDLDIGVGAGVPGFHFQCSKSVKQILVINSRQKNNNNNNSCVSVCAYELQEIFPSRYLIHNSQFRFAHSNMPL